MVRRNAGAAGVDQMTVEAFAEREEELLDRIHDKLQAGTYRFTLLLDSRVVDVRIVYTDKRGRVRRSLCACWP
jgi:regulator of protease activity HflC (stomatin/prohibitin superfamily)